MKNRGLLVLVTVVGLVILILSQCTGTRVNRTAQTKDNGATVKSGKPGDANPPGSKKTVTIAVSLEPDKFAALKRLSDAYSDMNVSFTYQLENIPDAEIYGKLKKSSQMGEAPDIMLLDNAWVNEFAALGYLQPVDELFTSEQQSGRLPIAVNQVKWNGYTWGVPLSIDPYVLAWNKAAAADLKADHAPESPEELLAWNKAWAHPEKSQYGIWFDVSSADDFIALSYSLTGAWDPAAGSVERHWRDPAAVKTMESFLNPQGAPWNTKPLGKAVPQPSEEWNPWDRLAKGGMAAMITTFSEYRKHEAAGIAISALPHTFGDSQGTGAWVKGKSFSVSSRSDDGRASLDWIKNMTGSEAALQLWRDAKILPTLVAAWNDPQIRDDSYYKSYEWLINHGMTMPSVPDNNKKLSALEAELLKLWKGEQDAKSFADQVAAIWSGATPPPPPTATPKMTKLSPTATPKK